jgi:hypothetical protein
MGVKLICQNVGVLLDLWLDAKHMGASPSTQALKTLLQHMSRTAGER